MGAILIPTDDGVEVRHTFHTLRSVVSENFNEHFKGIFDGHEQVPTKGLLATQRFAALSTTWTYVSGSKPFSKRPEY